MKICQAIGDAFVRVRLDLLVDRSHVHGTFDHLVVVGVVFLTRLVHKHSNELDSIAVAISKNDKCKLGNPPKTILGLEGLESHVQMYNVRPWLTTNTM